MNSRDTAPQSSAGSNLAAGRDVDGTRDELADSVELVGTHEPHAAEPSVFVVDDDAALLRLIRKLLETNGRHVETFTSAAEFLAAYRPDRAGCLVLDVRMPGMSGLALQERLATDEIALPILIVTGYGDVPVAVQAMRQGAFDFIEKPFSGQILIDRIEAALAEDARRRRTRMTREEVRRRRVTLTPRERQVMDLVVQGKPNKLVGSALHLSPKTVEVHRANVMKKMEAGSLAELVRMSLLVGEESHESGGS
ncbi:MAG: response regulator transcription factor [Planctomycetes bacterium]|nr:response regulator transcription factor [Planctomycetota bacterium]